MSTQPTQFYGDFDGDVGNQGVDASFHHHADDEKQDYIAPCFDDDGNPVYAPLQPSNPFILFRTPHAKGKKGGDQPAMSRQCGGKWRALSEEEKRPWYEEAARQAALHRQQYATYWAFRDAGIKVPPHPSRKKKKTKKVEGKTRGRNGKRKGRGFDADGDNQAPTKRPRRTREEEQLAGPSRLFHNGIGVHPSFPGMPPIAHLPGYTPPNPPPSKGLRPPIVASPLPCIIPRQKVYTQATQPEPGATPQGDPNTPNSSGSSVPQTPSPDESSGLDGVVDPLCVSLEEQLSDFAVANMSTESQLFRHSMGGSSAEGYEDDGCKSAWWNGYYGYGQFYTGY